MFGTANKILGLDIGSSCLKWVVYGKNRDVPVIYSWGIEKTPADSVKNGRILDKNRLCDKFKHFLDKNKIKAAAASVTMACPGMIVRTTDVPKFRQKELQNVMAYETERFISGTSEDYLIDYKMLGEEIGEDRNGLLKALVAAVPSSIIEDYTELLESLNIKPLAIDFHSNSACRFINRFLSNISHKNYVLLDLGDSGTIITIAEQGIPTIMRLMQIQTASEENARQIAFDILQSMEFYRSTTHKAIDALLMIGGGSCLKNIVKYISQQLNMDNLPMKGVLPMIMKNAMCQDTINLFCNVLGLAFREER